MPKGIQNHIKNEAKRIETSAQDTQNRSTIIRCRSQFSALHLTHEDTESQRGKMCLRVEGKQTPFHLQGLNLNGKLWSRRGKRDSVDIGPLLRAKSGIITADACITSLLGPWSAYKHPFIHPGSLR